MDYNRMSLNEFRKLFHALVIPELAGLPGTYQAAFAGPRWFRAFAKPSLALGGLGGWWGKEILADGTASNIVLRGGKFSKCLQMRYARENSFIDGRNSLVLHYQTGSPFPWLYVVDEIRQVDGKTLLGMTIPNVRGLRGMAFPFFLERRE